ncbi:hypothetical protein [Burkholderia sp. TSV86]|uniref:hypothetical protein n=1 Tax=Burkholderia sp. TSV86 TaxID=1385594 RepID=UPI000A8FD3D2|nr:hypothetical protein [Burkholderia sp. TSV86]
MTATLETVNERVKAAVYHIHRRGRGSDIYLRLNLTQACNVKPAAGYRIATNLSVSSDGIDHDISAPSADTSMYLCQGFILLATKLWRLGSPGLNTPVPSEPAPH